MLDTLITSKTRVKLLVKFFLNKDSASYLRHLESEFGESSNAIRIELNKFEEAGLLISNANGNKKIFRANTEHPLYSDIHSIVRKYMGLDLVIEKVVRKLGSLDRVYVTGDIAKGLDARTIDLLMVGDEIDHEYLYNLVDKAEKLIRRRISFLIFNEEEILAYLNNTSPPRVLLVWERQEQR